MPKLNKHKGQAKANQQELSTLASEIKKNIRASDKACENAIDFAGKAGAGLLKAKSLVKHGEWMTWLQENCACSSRQAERYMAIARHLKESSNATRASHLSQRQLLKKIAEARTENSPKAKDKGPSESQAQTRENNLLHGGEGTDNAQEGDPPKKTLLRIVPIADDSITQEESDQGPQDPAQDSHPVPPSSCGGQTATMPSVKQRTIPSQTESRDLTFESGSPEAAALDDLETEVKNSAKNHAAKILTAIKSSNLTASQVETELLSRLSQRLLEGEKVPF